MKRSSGRNKAGGFEGLRKKKIIVFGVWYTIMQIYYERQH